MPQWLSVQARASLAGDPGFIDNFWSLSDGPPLQAAHVSKGYIVCRSPEGEEAKNALSRKLSSPGRTGKAGSRRGV